MQWLMGFEPLTLMRIEPRTRIVLQRVTSPDLSLVLQHRFECWKITFLFHCRAFDICYHFCQLQLRILSILNGQRNILPNNHYIHFHTFFVNNTTLEGPGPRANVKVRLGPQIFSTKRAQDRIVAWTPPLSKVRLHPWSRLCYKYLKIVKPQHTIHDLLYL